MIKLALDHKILKATHRVLSITVFDLRRQRLAVLFNSDLR